MSRQKTIPSPYPYFGGKSRIMADIWQRFGPDVRNFVDPFLGSAASILSRPEYQPRRHIETVNDAYGMVCNFWRAVAAAPAAVAHHAWQPINENDMHARHAWLVTHGREIVQR